MKRISKALMSVLGAAIVFAGPGATWAAEVTLRCAHDQPKDGFYEIIWQEFKKIVEQRSNKRIDVTVNCCAQLGDEAQLLENMKIGSVDCAGASVGNIGGHIPPAGLLGAPYIIENEKHRERVVDGKGVFFKELTNVVAATGNFRALGMTTAGIRSVYNAKRPIMTPDDLKGLKIRTMTTPAQIKGWEALGALPTAIPFAEVYTALKSGVIDGAENSPMFLWNMKHHEGVKYYSITAHMVATGVTMLSERAYQKIPADLRALVFAAGDESAGVGRKYDDESNKEFLKKVVAAGIIVNEVDTAPFIAKTRHLHDQFAKEFKAEKLLEILRAEAKAAM